MHQPISYTIDAVRTIVGKNVTAEQWAREMRVPDRKREGECLDGSEITRITGVERKSWDPELFKDFEPIVQVTREALERASARVEDIDLVLFATSTPYFPQLGMDAFELLKRLGFPDHIPPIQLQAGCAAMARAMQILSCTGAKRPLIIAYEASSPYMSSPIYFNNSSHPLRDSLWMSAALFADGAGAMVLRRQESPTGFVFYSRDSRSFGGGPGFKDPLIHYLGGGASAPPGTKHAEELAAFGMNGPATREYYEKGMSLNHQAFERAEPGYLRTVKRVYMHQASPRLVELVRESLIQRAGATPEQLPKNAHLFGNLVAPATLKLLGDDVESEQIGPGDRVCFSVVGAGPERGGFITRLTGA